MLEPPFWFTAAGHPLRETSCPECGGTGCGWRYGLDGIEAPTPGRCLTCHGDGYLLVEIEEEE